MKISGPFRDPARRNSPKKWYLSYFVPKKNADGTVVLVEGKPVLERKRPYYESEDLAREDKPRITAQYAAAGSTSSGGILDRAAVEDYELARNLVPEASAFELAQFWRLHHPLQKVLRVKEVAPLFLNATLARLGKTAGYEDLKSRVGIFVQTFGERIPETITRGEFMRWLDGKPGRAKAGRSILNLKQTVCRFFNWMRAQDPQYVTHNPAGGIGRDQLPKVAVNDIRFLTLEDSEFYLRACERYDPELVAHEVVQLLAGVRADDEMANFQGDWVLPQTREVVIPAAIAKTEQREVINTLEPIFWEWWAVYGRKGVLRPRNYVNRWRRVRILAAVTKCDGQAKADELAEASAFKLQARPEFRAILAQWPWNARRRTFVTFHVAKEQSADATALIIRHRGDTYTLHNSYRGTGVTQEQGAAYFVRKPAPVAEPILAGSPTRSPRGIVKFRLERARLQTPAAVSA